MKKFNIKLLLTLIFANLFAVSSLFAKTVVIYHTSDVHGYYFSREKDGKKIGGFAALKSLINKEKDPVLLFDSGDWFQGTPEGSLSKGKNTIDIMNFLGYSASTIGNHEYDYGENTTKKLIDTAHFPVLGANVYLRESKKRAPYLKPYVILTVDEFRIAVIGTITPETSTSTLPTYVNHLEFRDMGDEVAKIIPELEKKKVDAILVLSHCGVSGALDGKVYEDSLNLKFSKLNYSNLDISKKSPGKIDVILGGHYHVGLSNGYRDEFGTLFVESYKYLRKVSRVELEFDDNTKKLIRSSAKLIDLDISEIPEDKDTLELLDSIKAQTDKQMSEKIGSSEMDLDRDHHADSKIGNFITDKLRNLTNTDVAFQNTYGIRDDIKKGDITLRDVFKALPFENTLVTMTLSGKQIEEVMRQNIGGNNVDIQVSGMSVKYWAKDDRSPYRLKIRINGKKLKPKKLYSVTTNNYLASGGEGGLVFLDGQEKVNLPQSIRDAVISAIKRESPIKKLPKTGRIKRMK
jgi:2',3'-cyclic-nucleotide 2'-phosphodiesterase (5'-nucleotidase family)